MILKTDHVTSETWIQRVRLWAFEKLGVNGSVNKLSLPKPKEGCLQPINFFYMVPPYGFSTAV